MDTGLIFEAIRFAQEHADGLTVIWTIVAGIAAASLLFAKPLYKYFFGQKSNTPSPTTVLVQTFDQEDFRNVLKEELKHLKSEDKKTESARNFSLLGEDAGLSGEDAAVELLAALDKLSNLRKHLNFPKMGPNIFPHDLDVIDFNPNGKFRVRCPSTKLARIFVGLFCLPHYIVFPAFVGEAIIGSWAVGGIVGFGLWIWRNYLGFYVSVDLAKRKHSIVMPAAASWSDGFPSVEIKSSYINNKWSTELLIANQVVVERNHSEERGNGDLEEFARALKWQFGDVIEVAKGVYVSPP